MQNDLIGEGQLMVCQRALKGRELLIIPILNFFAELDFFFFPGLLPVLTSICLDFWYSPSC